MGNPEETLDLLFQVNATFVSCRQLARMAATLSNGGVCTKGRQTALAAQSNSDLLAMMHKCSSDTSSLKLPTSGGESGAMFMVIPGVGGMAVYSPALNSSGVSARGTRLFTEISQTFSL